MNQPGGGVADRHAGGRGCRVVCVASGAATERHDSRKSVKVSAWQQARGSKRVATEGFG